MNIFKRPVKWAIYAGIVAVAAYLVYFLFFTRAGIKLTHTNVIQLANYMRSLGGYAFLIGMLAVLLQTVVPVVPFVLIAGANVIVFGLWNGFLINYSMSLVGASLAFIFAKYFAHDWIARRISRFPQVVSFNQQLERQGFLYVLIGRLIPVIPSSAINHGAGITRIKFIPFLLATCIGKLPIVFLESFIGYDLLHFRKNHTRLLILLAIFCLLFYLGNKFKHKLLGKKEN
ncbi:MAG: hypothetical protein K0R75_3616 [Paenibacillaceae bacterium]|nr:hypothetical protein [Paenibacillaceae bacterium]